MNEIDIGFVSRLLFLSLVFFIFYFMSKARDDQCTKRSCYGSIKHIVREGKIDSHINEVSVSEKKKRTKEMINRKKINDRK